MPTKARKPIAFVLTGLFATALSAVIYTLVLRSNPAEIATTYRLIAVLPILYFGYSRVMLKYELRENQQRIGRLKAELNMAGRVALSIGASTVVKLLFEPFVTRAVVTNIGPFVTVVPLVFDLIIGPIVNYVLLTIKILKK